MSHLRFHCRWRGCLEIPLDKLFLFWRYRLHDSNDENERSVTMYCCLYSSIFTVNKLEVGRIVSEHTELSPVACIDLRLQSTQVYWILASCLEVCLLHKCMCIRDMCHVTMHQSLLISFLKRRLQLVLFSHIL